MNWKLIGKPEEEGGWGLINVHSFRTVLVGKSLWNLISKENIWNKMISHKYIEPNSILTWIRRDDKSWKNGSAHWNVIASSFLMIGTYLGWNVGNGEVVRVGV